MDRFVSIIITHYAMNEERSTLLRSSLTSLFQTIKENSAEVIVVDNGGSEKDSKYLLDLCAGGKINTYIRNNQNMHFGYARNQALRVCNGDYIAVADNDIYYQYGWLDACLKVLEACPDKKIWATPIYNVAHWLPKYWVGELEVDGLVYKLNARAGSNIWVMRRKDFEEVGEFLIHRVAGTKFVEEANAKDYSGAVTPKLMAEDLGFRRGYNVNDILPVKVVLSDGKEVFFNQDEFKRQNKRGNIFMEQKSFNPQARIRFKGDSS